VGKKLGARRQLSRLAEIEERLRESRRELLIAQEHETIQAELARDAGLKMLVADTPGASLAYRKANGALVKARNELDEVTAALEQLSRQRDDLLKAIPEPISSSG
jgi:hypothetical protein